MNIISAPRLNPAPISKNGFSPESGMTGSLVGASVGVGVTGTIVAVGGTCVLVGSGVGSGVVVAGTVVGAVVLVAVGVGVGVGCGRGTTGSIISKHTRNRSASSVRSVSNPKTGLCSFILILPLRFARKWCRWRMIANPIVNDNQDPMQHDEETHPLLYIH